MGRVIGVVLGIAVLMISGAAISADHLDKNGKLKKGVAVEGIISPCDLKGMKGAAAKTVIPRADSQHGAKVKEGVAVRGNIIPDRDEPIVPPGERIPGLKASAAAQAERNEVERATRENEGAQAQQQQEEAAEQVEAARENRRGAAKKLSTILDHEKQVQRKIYNP